MIINKSKVRIVQNLDLLQMWKLKIFFTIFQTAKLNFNIIIIKLAIWMKSLTPSVFQWLLQKAKEWNVGEKKQKLQLVSTFQLSWRL